MGGKPSTPKKDVILPNPQTGNLITGVSISGSKGCTSGNCSKCRPRQNRNTCCDPCSLVVPANVSSSSAEVSLGAFSVKRCPAGWTTNKFSRPDKNGYDGECTKDKSKIPLGTGLFSASTKLIAKPSIPFRITFNGNDQVIDTISLYHPSPVRIENVQHDAVLSLGDPSDGDTFIILIPLISTNMGGEAATFVGKIAPAVDGVLASMGDLSVVPNPIDISTGADWNLTKLIEVGKQSVASGGFFTWNSSTQTSTVIRDNPVQRTLGWKSTPGPQYVLMAEPVPINSIDLEAIRRLPHTKPEQAIHYIGNVTYKAGPPRGCKKGPSIMSMLKQNTYQKKFGAGALSPETLGSIVMWVFLGMLMLWGLSVGLGWALDNVRGDMLRRWGDALKTAIAKAMSKSKTIKAPAVKSPLSSKPPAIPPI